MIPHRLTVKYDLAAPADLDPSAIIPVFHAWIQNATVPGMLIDVADYAHMVDGPGVVLIGHDVDYALDGGGGRLGLLHRRKRGGDDDLPNNLAGAFHHALVACRALQAEPRLGGKLRFDTGAATLSVPDRLHAPNTDDTWNRLRADVEALAASLYEGAAVRVHRDADDPRRPFTVRLTAEPAPSLDTLIQRAASLASAHSATGRA